MGVINWVFGKSIAKEVNKQVKHIMSNFKYEVPGKEQTLSQLVNFRQSEYRTWASGNPIDLLKFYSTYSITPGEMSAGSRQLFWEWVRGVNTVPKLHYPAAEMIMNQMKSLLFAEDLDLYVSVKGKDDEESTKKSEELTKVLTEILEANNHNEKYQTASMYETYSGSVAFRPIFRSDLSDYPIMVPYPAEKVSLRTELGMIQEIIFIDTYHHKDKKYTLRSKYGRGYITYELTDDKGNRVPVTTVPDLQKGYEDVVFMKDGKPIPILMAVFKKNRSNSNEFEGTEYGGSDFEGLMDTFNLIDEIYSQKNLYVRRTRPIMSISERLLKVDKNGNEIIPNEYETDLLVTRGDEKTTEDGKVHRDIPDFNPQPYDESIKQELKTCWMKIGMAYTTVGLEAHSANISGAALEIKEKSSVIVRSNKIKLWQKALKDVYRLMLIYNSLKQASMVKIEEQVQYTIADTFDHEYIVNFPTYNNQTFEERIQEAQKALGTVYDYEQAVRHGLKYSGYSEEDIQEIVKNIKIEQGIALIGDQLGATE
jgi:hypothetical protein